VLCAQGQLCTLTNAIYEQTADLSLYSWYISSIKIFEKKIHDSVTTIIVLRLSTIRLDGEGEDLKKNTVQPHILCYPFIMISTFHAKRLFIPPSLLLQRGGKGDESSFARSKPICNSTIIRCVWQCKSEMRAWSRNLRAIRMPRINSDYRAVNFPLKLDYKMKLFIFMNK